MSVAWPAAWGSPLRPVPSSRGELRFLCPMCCSRRGSPDTKYHLYFNTRKGAFHCFRCGWGGFRGADWESGIRHAGQWEEALRKLNSSPSAFVWRDPPLRLPEGAVPVTPRETPEAFSYLAARGMTEEDVEKYDIQFVREGRYRGRIIIPDYDCEGELVYWVARTIEENREPKYIAPSSAKVGRIYRLASISQEKPVVITEGVMDAITVEHAGAQAVALYGKNPSDFQLELLYWGVSNAIVFLDSDAKYDAVLLARRLKRRGVPSVSFTFPPVGEDPGSLSSEEVQECLSQVVEMPDSMGVVLW